MYSKYYHYVVLTWSWRH